MQLLSLTAARGGLARVADWLEPGGPVSVKKCYFLTLK